MSDTKPVPVFPRRDAEGRVISLVEMLAAGLLGGLLSLAILALLDGLLALFGVGSFGHASGWLAAVLPVFLFVDEFRAWRGGSARFAVAPLGVLAGLVLGLIAAGAASSLPALVSGAVGALVAVSVYSVVWYVGIRWLNGRPAAGGAR
jgi:hypothetical protein